MNKNIILSSVAAAALATLLTGCGSDSSSTTSGSTVSGSAVKAPLKNATVTIGSATATTAADGSYTVSGATGSSITVSGGVMVDANGTETPNTLTLKATMDSSNASNIVSIATTLVEDMKTADTTLTTAQAKARVMNLLGLTNESDIYVNPNNLSNEAKNAQAVLWKVLTTVSSSTTATNAVLKSLSTSASSGAVSIAALNTALGTALDAAKTEVPSLGTSIDTTKAFVTEVVTVGNMAKQEEALITAAYNNDTNLTKYEKAFSGAINLDGNTTSSGTDAALFYSDNGSTEIGVKYDDTNNTNYDINFTANNIDANTSVVAFGFKDLNATAKDDNTTSTPETGELLISLTKLVDANNTDANASYQMRLNKLKVTFDSSTHFLKLYANSNTTLTIGANSNTSYAKALTGNVSALLGATSLSADGNSSNEFLNFENDGHTSVNIARFANYVKNTFDNDYDSSTTGNFSVDMLTSGKFKTGNYSLKLYLELGDRTLTKRDGLDKLGKANVEVGGTDYTGFKVIDHNLNIQ